MANLGICRRCKSCQKLSPSRLDGHGRKVSSALIWCGLLGMVPESLGWDSEVPDNCPYRLEHIVTNDDLVDLVDTDIDQGE